MKKHGDDETGGLLKRESKQENMKKRDAKIKVDKIFLCITLQSNDQLRLYPGGRLKSLYEGKMPWRNGIRPRPNVELFMRRTKRTEFPLSGENLLNLFWFDSVDLLEAS